MEAAADKMTGEARDEAFRTVRRLFIAANGIDTEDPEPLYEYYLTYMHEGIRPSENAISALHYASDLAPQDVGVRMNSAIAYLIQGIFLMEGRSMTDQDGATLRLKLADENGSAPASRSSASAAEAAMPSTGWCRPAWKASSSSSPTPTYRR